MRRPMNPKRVSFASDVNLCQVRLFLSEDSPSQVGFSAQDHLQAKPSHASGISSDDNLPPGFEGAQASNLWRTKLFQIPVIKWENPPTFSLEANWRVVAGEESQEREVQKQREMRVLEAIYPRPSAIPLNPSAPAEHTVFPTDNQHTPLIPITCIEDDDAADTVSLQHDASPAVGPMNLTTPLMEDTEGATMPSHSTTTVGASSSSSSGSSISSSLEPDDSLTVALAALSSVMANDHGNLIDSELLIKILSNPQILGQLTTNQGGGGSNLPAMSSGNVQHNGPTNVRPPGLSLPNPTTLPPATSGPLNLPPPPPPPRMVGPTPSAIPSTSSPPSSSKDMNYFKSLIQQHGGERQDTLLPPPPPPRSEPPTLPPPLSEPPMPPPQYYTTGWGSQHIDSSPVPEPSPPMVSSRSSRDPNRPKIMKPCMFFNSQRGCRHGVKCAFLHDSPTPPSPSQRRVSGFPDVQSAKRMKMDREITGT